MNVLEMLKRCGYKFQTVEVDGVERYIVVRDKEIKELKLKPVAIGGKLVKE